MFDTSRKRRLSIRKTILSWRQDILYTFRSNLCPHSHCHTCRVRLLSLLVVSHPFHSGRHSFLAELFRKQSDKNIDVYVHDHLWSSLNQIQTGGVSNTSTSYTLIWISIRTHFAYRTGSTLFNYSSECIIHVFQLQFLLYHRDNRQSLLDNKVLSLTTIHTHFSVDSSLQVVVRLAPPPSIAPLTIVMMTIPTGDILFPEIGSDLTQSTGPCHVTLHSPFLRVLFLWMSSICVTNSWSIHPPVPFNKTICDRVFHVFCWTSYRVNMEMYFLSSYVTYVESV